MLAKERVGRLLFKLSMPSIVGMMVLNLILRPFLPKPKAA